MTAVPEDTQGFVCFADLLPERLLLVSRDGEIRAANRDARESLFSGAPEVAGRPLKAFVDNPPAQIADYLRLCSRSSTSLPGTLTFRPCGTGAGGTFHSAGSAFRAPGSAGLVLLRLTPRGPTLSRFMALSEKVEQLTREVHRRHRAERSANEQRELLRDTDKRKDVFLATLAHELRNPLAPIRNGLDLIQALRGDAAACEEPLQIMERQFDHLVHLVDDLLDVSRISRGKIELRKERLDLAEIIHAALEMSEGGLHQGDRQVSVNVPSEPLAVEGDRVRLVQIIANLLNNAAKFTDADGRIDVRVTPRGEWVEIQVQDDGRGIPLERLDHIFEMFSQAEPGLGGGLGIGLSLVRGLVEMHGGTVRAASEGPGSGATFTVSLPLCDSAPAQAMTDTATELDVLPAQCRVLVVDDNRDITKGLDLVLTMLGAEVRVAHDGAEAIRVFDDWPPTHVLMDLGMPGMDGYEAARRLRAKHPGSAFRLIGVTGWGQEEERRRTREAGFDEHLVKPVGVADLKAVLSR